ncbi:hypothetical protein QCA50_008598 [Cerrena zonata]|uniref:Fungal-type protein kinase domain-containing protein n=1 Tax=Cerrena zonata TaxID=2478898 RepID=A0AAW0G4H5_9APHY
MSEYTHCFSLDEWVEAVLGQSPAQISNWESFFTNAGLFMDPTLRQAVTDYLRADSLKSEELMYKPFCIASNRILDFYLENAKDARPFLVKDILLCRNHPITIGLYRDVYCSPDVVLVTQTVFDLIQNREKETGGNEKHPTSGIKWTDLFSIFEFNTSHERNYGDLMVNEWCRRQNITRDELMSPKKLKDFLPPKTESSDKVSDYLPPRGTSQKIPCCPQPIHPPKRPAASHADPIITKKRRTQAPAPPLEDNKLLFKSPVNYEKKMASYALEMLSSTNGTRSHFFQCLIEGDIVRFHYSDPTGIAWSTQFSWIRNLEKFAAILLAIAYCDHECLGMTVPGLTPPEPEMGIPRSLSISPLPFKGYYLDEPVTKISVQLHTREPEVELLLKARKAGLSDHLPEPHMWSTRGQQWCSSKDVWGVLYPNNATTKRYEPRTQDIIVLIRYQPLEKVLTPQNMYSLFNQLFAVLYSLRYKAYMLHRDITPSNLMCEVLTEADDTEVFKLILIDIDLAVLLDKYGYPIGERSKHHTGTFLFTAIDLLDSPESPRFLRHDFESVIYVALWLLVKSRDVFLRWENPNTPYVTSAKTLMRERFFDLIDTTFCLRDEFSAYLPWIYSLWRLFWKASIERDDFLIQTKIFNEDIDFDLETLGGHVTYDKIRELLSGLRPKLAQSVPNLL